MVLSFGSALDCIAAKGKGDRKPIVRFSGVTVWVVPYLHRCISFSPLDWFDLLFRGLLYRARIALSNWFSGLTWILLDS